MSKRALGCLLCAAALFAAHVPNAAQEAKPQPDGAAQSSPDSPPAEAPSKEGGGGAFEGTGFKPGEFFTIEDAEHLQAALGYLDLTPKDLSFEKKHRDDRLRLTVADAVLDRPLSLPAVADRAARAFSAKNRIMQEAMEASRLLDLPQQRWHADELLKDGYKEAARTAEYEESRESGPTESERRRLSRRHRREQASELFGGLPERRSPHPEEYDDVSDAGMRASVYTSTLGTLSRIEDPLSGESRPVLAGVAGGLVADEALPLPGYRPGEGNFLELATQVDILPRLTAAARLAAVLEQQASYWVQKLRTGTRITTGTASEVGGVTGNVVEAWEGPWGKFVIGGTGPNTYEGDDFIGIIDLGGDDTYRGRVACAIGLPDRCPISFVLDLGGNDTYEGGDFTQGFGFLGVGMLVDLGKGSDRYSAGFCAQGAGLCGVGILHDDGGEDTYKGDSFVQGAGMFGFGHLIDESGDDVYRACRYAQAFAQVKGVGVLTDGDGNDLYYAGGKYLHQPLFNDRYQSLSQGFAIGNRYEETGGGIALLLDEGDGNDVYQADIYGQGSSYWYALGMLVDRGGNDTYSLGQYGQGAGIHLSAGILVDLKGNDTYTNPYGVGTGGAHDWSVGWLIDRAGNDLYQGNGQGQGLNYSVGILLDCVGDDSHISNNDTCIGKGVNNDVSLLLDLAGKDQYGPKEVQDGAFTRRSRTAMVYDVPEGWFIGIDEATWPTPQDPPPEEAVVQHILISWKGKSARVTLKDPERTHEQATELLHKVLKAARSKGADWRKLQVGHNEDSVPHNEYVASPGAMLVKEFNDLALSLGVGQIGWCESQYGYHIIKRLE